MITLVTGSLLLSMLHALIPSHWLPVLSIGKSENWSRAEAISVTLVAGLAHAASTAIIGVVIGLVGVTMAGKVVYFTHFISPAILVALGLFYIYQHQNHKHHHFHIPANQTSIPKNRIILSLAIAMFFSPCLEIEAYFLMAGTMGWPIILLTAMLYTVVTVTGMMAWVGFTYNRLVRFNWHSLEHNAGIITGLTLVVTGIISFFIH